MADFHRLVETGELKTNRLAKLASGEIIGVQSMSYDKDFDALVLLAFEPASALIAHYVDDHVALLYEEDSLEIAGLQVENFELSFLPKHSELNKAWMLSDALGQKFDNLGEMIIAVQHQRPKIAREIMRAAGNLPRELEAVLAA
jgi:hypothetical protein